MPIKIANFFVDLITLYLFATSLIIDYLLPSYYEKDTCEFFQKYWACNWKIDFQHRAQYHNSLRKPHPVNFCLFLGIRMSLWTILVLSLILTSKNLQNSLNRLNNKNLCFIQTKMQTIAKTINFILRPSKNSQIIWNKKSYRKQVQSFIPLTSKNKVRYPNQHHKSQKKKNQRQNSQFGEEFTWFTFH